MTLQDAIDFIWKTINDVNDIRQISEYNLFSALNREITNRKNAETILQNNINNIKQFNIYRTDDDVSAEAYSIDNQSVFVYTEEL